MNKILAVLQAALDFVFGRKQVIADLKQQIVDLNVIIVDLRAAVEANGSNDTELVQAAADAKAAQKVAEDALVQINADILAAEVKADELTAAMSEV